jgi:uncharacterized membrane protein YgaE (UPF0421/DUF939 family)
VVFFLVDHLRPGRPNAIRLILRRVWGVVVVAVVGLGCGCVLSVA